MKMANKSMTILYTIHDNIYVNLTNKCPCACTFCLRQTRDSMEGSDPLWLEHDPNMLEVLRDFDLFAKSHDMSQYKEIVFCGFGEPTEAFFVLLPVARYVKAIYHKPIRINTNGLGNLIQGRNIVPEMESIVDTISISLNTPNADRYHQLVRSRFGDQSFDAMLDFARECTKYIPNVILTTVDTTLTKEEEAQCRQICQDLGVTYRIRSWED
jgi:radical SAM enzyme (TIGR04100 family)